MLPVMANIAQSSIGDCSKQYFVLGDWERIVVADLEGVRSPLPAINYPMKMK